MVITKWRGGLSTLHIHVLESLVAVSSLLLYSYSESGLGVRGATGSSAAMLKKGLCPSV